MLRGMVQQLNHRQAWINEIAKPMDFTKQGKDGLCVRIRDRVLNTTFNNISVIIWNLFVIGRFKCRKNQNITKTISTCRLLLQWDKYSAQCVGLVQSRHFHHSLCLKLFSPTYPKAKFRKKFYLFKQILS